MVDAGRDRRDDGGGASTGFSGETQSPSGCQSRGLPVHSGRHRSGLREDPQAAGQVGAVLAPGPAEAPWPQPVPRIASRQPPECWPDLMLPPSRIRDDGSTD